MKKHSKLGKRVLSVLMSIAVMISVIVPALTVFDFTAAAADGKLTVNSDGSFRVLQVPDIQTKSPLPEDTVTMIETAIAKYNPNLIVMTGDNVVGCVNDREFRNTADEIVSLFKDESGNTIPFAVTFGNHDYEGNNVSDATGWTTTYGSHTIKRMYDYFVNNCGAIDFDYNITPVDDVATGYIDVYDQAGSKVVRRIIIINSATYDDNGGYGKAGYNQSNGSGTYTDDVGYNSIVSNVNSWTGDSSITCLAFQHIPLREFYTSGILTQSSSGLSAVTTGDSSISGSYAPNTSNATVSGYYNEPCSCSYSDTSALYKALAKDNVLGIFYGHDHGNTLVDNGTVYGQSLVQGYGGGLNTEWNGAGMAALRYMTITSGGELNTDYYTSKSSDSNFINKNEYETFGRKFSSTAGAYISDITVNGDKNWDNAVSLVSNAGFTPITANVNISAGSGESERADLNKGCGAGTPYIVLGYKTTTDVNSAITDIKAVVQNHNTLSDTILVNEMTYRLANTAGVYDLNQGAEGSYIYLYYTTDKRAGAPITDLGVAVDRYGDVAETASSVGKSFAKPYQVVRNTQEPNMSGTSNQTVVNMNDGTNATKMYIVTRSTETDLTREYLALCEAMRTYGSVTDSVLYTAASWSDYSTARNLVYNYIAYFNGTSSTAPGTVSSDALKTAAENLRTKYNALEKKVVDNSIQAETTSIDNEVKIAVPETIYLQPSSGTATQAQYYLNDTFDSSGNLIPVTSTPSTTGTFEIRAPGAANVHIKAVRANPTVSNGKITSVDYKSNDAAHLAVQLTNDTLNTGSVSSWDIIDSWGHWIHYGLTATPDSNGNIKGTISPHSGYPLLGSNGLSQGGTTLIEWQIAVTKNVGDLDSNGTQETVTTYYYAYTTVYAPYVSAVSGTAGAGYTSNNSDRRMFVVSTSWITGIHGIKNSYPGSGNTDQTGSTIDPPLIDSSVTILKHPKYGGSASPLPSGVGANWFYKNDENASAYGGTAQLYVDTSRYTNYNQIPQFTIGSDVNYCDNWAISGSNGMTARYVFGLSHVTEIADTYSGGTRFVYYADGKNSDIRVTDGTGKRFSVAPSATVSTGNTSLTCFTRLYGKTYGGRTAYTWAYCDFVYVNRSSLRTTISNEIRNSVQEKWDTGSTFSAYKLALMKAYLDLGTPSATQATTDTSQSSLESAYTACKNKQLANATVKSNDFSLIRVIDAATGTSDKWSISDITNLGTTTEATVSRGQWFIHRSTDIEGYSLIGGKLTTGLSGTLTSNTADALGLSTDNPYIYEYKKKDGDRDEVKSGDSSPYLNAYYYYNLPDYTLTIDLDGGTGISYTSVIGTPGSTLTMPTVSRSGYTFAGWTLSGAGSTTSGNQNMTYTFGRGNATLTANWVANPQNLIIDSNGGRYTGNLLYTSVNTSLSGGSSSTITYNIKPGNDSFEVSGSFAAGAPEQTLRIPMWCYLKYNQTYRITFTSTTPYSELYLFKDGSEAVRNAFTVTSKTTQQGGLYVYTADFTVGVTGNSDCTWIGNQDTTGSYQIRLDQNSSDGGNYTVSGLRIEELTESTGSDVYIIQTTDSTRYVPTPKRDGYQFKGWTITPADNGSHISGTTYTYGWSDTTLVANWQETTVSYDVNHDSIGVNLYAPYFETQTVNGITYSYDPETDVITLNGTASQNAHFEITPFIPEADSTYNISIEKVGGTATRSGSACIVLEAKTAGGGICRLGSGTDAKLGNFYANEFNSGVSASWSFTSEQANSGNYKTLGLWTWVNTGASITFNDYKIKIKVEKSNSSTEFSPNTHYVLDSGAGLFPEVSRTDYTLLGWSKASDAETPTYIVGQNAVFKDANTTLYAVWLETATSDERVGTVEVAKGITVTNLDSDTPSVIYETDKKKYEYIADETYEKLCEAYETALAAFTNKATKNLTTAQALYDARKALDADEYQSGSYVYNAPVVYYTDKFEIKYSGVDSSKIKIPAGTYSVKDMNLNWYSTATLDETETAYDNAMAAKDQETVNSNVVKMASNLVLETETVKTSNPVLKIYDTETGAVNYVHNNKGSYTYYCYTNNPSPKLRITVEDTAGSGRILYPTKATENDITVNKDDSANLAKTENLYSLTNVKRTDSVDNGYSKYLKSAAKLGTTYGENYYNQKQEITLTPQFSGTDGSISYTMTATDDAYTPNAISSASLSGLQTQEKSATDKKITIYISYHKTTSEAGKSNSFCATGAQVDLDKHLNQYHLFRSSGGAMNWELPYSGDEYYTVNDGTYGQTDRGSFTYTFKYDSSASTSQMAENFKNGKLPTIDVNAIKAYLKTESNYTAMKSLPLTSSKTGTGSTAGLGYGVWGNNWSYNYYPRTGAYTYVHLVDRWGNVFDKVFCVGPQDYKEIQSQSNGNGYTLLEDGGSGIDTLSLNAAGYELLTDNDSTLEDGVYKTTGNTVRIKTGEANKSYTLTMKDKATNSSTATLTSDENGIITLSIEDTAYTSGVYTFMLDQTEINLYDGVDTGKYIKEVYSDEAEEGETARLTVITTGEVSKVRTTDTEGNTITNNVYTEREDGTREFVFERTLAAGTYSYRIEAKSGKVWYDEGKTGVLTFTEKVLASGVIKAAEYDAATGVCKVTVEGRAGKVQIVSADGSTRTYTRYHKSVTSITSYDASGAAVSDTSRELDTEVWTLNVWLTGTDYTAVGKFEAGWNRADSATKKLVINK